MSAIVYGWTALWFEVPMGLVVIFLWVSYLKCVVKDGLCTLRAEDDTMAIFEPLVIWTILLGLVPWVSMMAYNYPPEPTMGPTGNAVLAFLISTVASAVLAFLLTLLLDAFYGWLKWLKS